MPVNFEFPCPISAHRILYTSMIEIFIKEVTYVYKVKQILYFWSGNQLPKVVWVYYNISIQFMPSWICKSIPLQLSKHSMLRYMSRHIYWFWIWCWFYALYLPKFDSYGFTLLTKNMYWFGKSMVMYIFYVSFGYTCN